MFLKMKHSSAVKERTTDQQLRGLGDVLGWPEAPDSKSTHIWLSLYDILEKAKQESVTDLTG